jgi:hypothetical protein
MSAAVARGILVGSILLGAMAFLATVAATDAAAQTPTPDAGEPSETAPSQSATPNAFRMEGDPKIETVFGDAEQYKKYVDRFYETYDEMARTRDDFSRNVQAVMASLAADQPGRGGVKCPVDAVALAYARALKLGQAYHKSGKDLEASYVSLHDLDQLGETYGLTPDYRWKVARALKLYPEVLKDFREMRATFQGDLEADIKYHRCDAQALIAKGEELEKANPPPTAVLMKGPPPPKPDKKNPAAPPIPANTATFFVDNSSCQSSLRVYLDGTLLGEVGSTAKAAFQSYVGQHDLCLIPSTSQQQCGDQGTLRKTYIHDG